jgi:hypothetical protein
MFAHNQVTRLGLFLAFLAFGGASGVAAERFVVARDGRPAATIIVAAAPTDVAAFAAQEIQYHVQRITGAVLPIRLDAEKVEGMRIIVGPSAAANQFGAVADNLKDQEYLIEFRKNTLILLGKDAPQRTRVDQAKGWAQPTGPRLPAPPMFDEQATSYAVHDFLERFCNVRWFGPGELEMVTPTSATLAVEPKDVRRAPGFMYRHPWGPQEIITNQWNHPSAAEIDLFFARLRSGGEKYQCNHSFDGYYDRFWRKNPKCPEVFAAPHRDWFTKNDNPDPNARPGQLCYSNPGLVAQVVADARRYFDGHQAEQGAKALGDYFGIVPMDNGGWCKCAECQAQMTPQRRQQAFANGVVSDYYFTFVNKVAREVAKTHPGKYLATLAYYQFAYRPQRIILEPNVSVQMCLQARHVWAPGVRQNDMRFYRDWVDNNPGRRFYVWLYYNFPEYETYERGHCFPGFSIHHLGRLIKMYARDGIRGAFLNNTSEQVDLYITLRLFDDPSLDVDALLDEFFTRYYGAAGNALKRMYLRIEEIYSNPANYPEQVRTDLYEQFHQDLEMAWKYLGTAERMAELAAMMAEAEKAPGSAVEKQRVALFRKSVWDYMVQGRQQYLEYLAKQGRKL